MPPKKRVITQSTAFLKKIIAVMMLIKMIITAMKIIIMIILFSFAYENDIYLEISVYPYFIRLLTRMATCFQTVFNFITILHDKTTWNFKYPGNQVRLEQIEPHSLRERRCESFF